MKQAKYQSITKFPHVLRRDLSATIVDRTFRATQKSPGAKAESKTSFIPNAHAKLLPPLELQFVGSEKKGESYSIVQGRHRIGRAESSEICISDTSVSAFHATLEYKKEGKVTVYDAASRNGISVNGKTAPTLSVKVGQTLQVGCVYLRLERKSKEKTRRFQPQALLAGGAVLLLTSILAYAGVQKDTPSPTEPLQTEKLQEASAASAAKPSSTPGPKKAKVNASPRKGLSKARRPQAKSLAKSETTNRIVRKIQSAMDQKEYRMAYLLCRDLLQVSPKNPFAVETLKQLQHLAGQLYEEAIMAGIHTKEGQSLLNLTTQMTPRTTAIHQRAVETLRGVRQ